MLLLLALSFVLPTLLGWVVVQSVWRSSPWRIGIGLALILGSAITGTVHFLILSLSDSTTITFATAEASLAALVVALWIYLRRTPQKWSHRTYSRDVFGWGFEVVAVLSGIAILLICDAQRHGGWDAVAMWNLKARLILTSSSTPVRSLVDPTFSGLHPDYPLLLPALVARGWRYIGSSAPIVPILLGGWFALVTVVVTTAGVEAISTSSQGWIAGSLLVSTPLFINIAASQYADIVVCCFVTAAVVLYCIHDSIEGEQDRLRHLPVLAGIAAAAAACTKNEGILFVAVLVAARVILGVTRRRTGDTARELVSFALGASAGLIALAVFKFMFSPPNDTVRLVSLHTVMSRLTDGHLNREIFSRFRSALMFGAWYVNPLPVMALHTTIVYARPTDKKSRAWFTPAFVLVAMMCGYYMVYMFSPYDLESHLASSLDRLVLQLWPTALLLYSCLVAPKSGLASSGRRYVGLRVAAAAAIVAVAVALYFGRNSTAVAVGTVPRIEVSRAEVTTGQSYSLKITGIKGPQVYVSYSIDGKSMGQFGAYLGDDETVTFELSEGTPKGTYQFNAVRSADDPAWVPFDDPAKLVVK